MSTTLWILRHGEAEPHDVRPDPERRLTEKGERQSREAGRALAALGVTPVVVLTSPKVRAHDTARLACEALGSTPVDHAPLSSGFEGGDALDVLTAAADGEAVLIVGHEPDLSRVVYDLTGARVDMKKGGAAAVRMDGARGELIALLRPRELSAIAS